MDKRKIRDVLRLSGALLFSWLYIPHLIAFFATGGSKRELITSDLMAIESQVRFKLSLLVLLLYMLHNN